MVYNVETYILLFYIYAFFGWIIEVVDMLFKPEYHRFVNRGFLIGPYLPIYGCRSNFYDTYSYKI